MMDHRTERPAERQHLPYLDGWRGIAIIFVLMDHFANVEVLGMVGVQVFFVLSGLLMARVLFDAQMPLRTFYRRRVARIIPAMYVYMVAMALWSLAVGGIDTSASNFAWAAVFLGTYLPGTDIWDDALLGHLWSLNVEEHSYMLMSVVALLARRSGVRWPVRAMAFLSAACLVGFAIHRAWPALAPPGTSAFYLRTEVAALSVFASATIHVLLRELRYEPTTSLFVGTGLITTALLATVVAVPSIPVGGNVLSFVVIPLFLAATVNFLPAAPPIVMKALSNRTLTWFGLISYSLYLWQYPFYRLVGDNGGEWTASVRCMLSIAVATISYYALERPMRRWIAGPGCNSVTQ